MMQRLDESEGEATSSDEQVKVLREGMRWGVGKGVERDGEELRGKGMERNGVVVGRSRV